MNAKTLMLTNQCVDWIKNWFENESGGAKGVVIGISGGKDSTVVAGLCVKALGKDKVLGVLMPNGEQPDIDDSIAICEHLGIDYKIVNIGPVVQAMVDVVESDSTKFYDFGWADYEDNNPLSLDEFVKLNPHTLTNIPPRIRMTTLYAIGQELGYRVVGTGNASEAYVGYFTKWGDGACDFNPIGNLTTEQVIAIGDELGLPYDLVHKTPADGLCGKTDEDNLGYSYADVNAVMDYGSCGDEEIDEKISKAYIYSQHKRNPIPKFASPILLQNN